MCNICAKHKEVRRDASNHAAGNPQVVIGTGASRPKELGVSINSIALRAENIPDDFPFLKLAIQAQETGTLQGGEE